MILMSGKGPQEFRFLSSQAVLLTTGLAIQKSKTKKPTYPPHKKKHSKYLPSIFLVVSSSNPVI